MTPRTLRWVGLAVCLAALVAAVLAIFALPYYLVPDGTPAGWTSYWRAAAGIAEEPDDLTAVARVYLDASAFLVGGMLAMAASVGARSRAGRVGGGVAAVLVGLVLLVSCVAFATWSIQEGEESLHWLRVVGAGAFGIVVLATAVLRLVGLAQLYDFAVATLLGVLGLGHLYTVNAVVSAADAVPSLLAWTPVLLFLLAAVGAAVATRGAGAGGPGAGAGQAVETVRAKSSV